jgi:hypothetical protein
MMKLRLLVGGVCLVVALAVSVGPAAADPTAGPPICAGPASGVMPISGKYRNLTITGERYVPSGTVLKVRRDLTIAPGSCLDAFTLGTVTVGGNVRVAPAATLALGCTPGSLGPPLDQPPCDGRTTNDTVGGSIFAWKALTMYLDGDTIGGSVFSFGGGPGLAPDAPFVNFPVKDNTVDGNVVIWGWHGGWAGVIRNTVGGNVIFSQNVSVQDPDAMEVVTNTIARNLICFGNSPAVQVGDSGGSPNNVGGKKIGQCTAPGI